MKLAIEGFSQEYATTLVKVVSNEKGGTKEIRIDCTDLVLLRWFVDFFPEMKKMTINGKEYAWLSHNKISEDLPILAISKQACIDRMQKLVEFEILDYQLVKENGTFSFYGFGKNYANLCRSNNIGVSSQSMGVSSQLQQGSVVNYNRGMLSTTTGVCSQLHNKDNSIIDSDTNNSSIKDNIRNKEIDSIISYLNEKAHKNFKLNSKDTRKVINARLNDGYSVDDLKKVVDIKSEEWLNTDMDEYLRPSTLFAPSKIEGYLNAKPKNSRQNNSRKVNQEIKYVGTFVDDEDYDDDTFV